LGLAKNSRRVEAGEPALADAHARYRQTGVAARVFADRVDQTRDSGSRARRVVGKAAYLPKGPKPRFVVTSLSTAEREAQPRYEGDYCARGDRENRIKEQPLMLCADRTSTAWLRSNPLRLWFSSAAYVLVQALRRLGLAGTALAPAPGGSIRLWLFKIGALVRVTVRTVWVSLSSACPSQQVFTQVYDNLRRAQPAVRPPLRC
jgi:Transposase DDE domain group 1